MPRIKFPYGRGYIEYDIPDERLVGLLVSGLHRYRSAKSQEELVRGGDGRPDRHAASAATGNRQKACGHFSERPYASRAKQNNHAFAAGGNQGRKIRRQILPF